MRAARLPAILVIVALLVLGLAVGHDESAPDDLTTAVGPAVPAFVAKADALSSLWFCNGGTATDGDPADHRVVLSNSTDESRIGTITTMASTLADGTRPDPVRSSWELAPYGRLDFRLADEIGQAPYASATVEVSGGGVLVEHRVSGPLGNDSGPCISTASPQWFVPLGTTSTVNDPTSREILVFYNPFQGDAVIEAEFSTDSGLRGAPEVFKGLVVPGTSVVAVDLASAAVAVADQVSASISARSGRVVVSRIQVFDDASFRQGLAVSDAVPDTALNWVFPVGQLGEGRRERLVVYNPSAAVAEVDVEVRPADPTLGVEPFQLSVQPRQHTQIDLDAEPRLTALVESATAFSVWVTSADGNPVVAERIVTVAPGSAGSGVATSTGSAHGATRLFASFAADEVPGSQLVVVNPSLIAISRISLDVVSDGSLTPIARYQNLELQPGDRLTIAAAELLDAAGTVILSASEPVVAERDLVNETERSLAIAVPEASTTAIIGTASVNPDTEDPDDTGSDDTGGSGGSGN